VQYFILVGSNVVKQPFRDPKSAHDYNNFHRLGGQIISEYQLQELMNREPEPRNHPQSSIIKRANYGAERNVRIPVCHPATTGHNRATYRPTGRIFKPKKVKNFRGLIE
jgi:hypothetical protein